MTKTINSPSIGAPATKRELAAGYLRIVGFAYPLQVISVIISFLMRSTERVAPPLFSSIAGLVTNFILNWILIYGRLGMPRMGAAGAAVGTLCSAVINLLLLLFFLLRDKRSVQLHFKDMFCFDGGFLKVYFSKCFPIICPAITFVICMIGFIFNVPLLSLFGLGSEAMFYGKYMLLIYVAAGTIRTCNIFFRNS